MTTETAWATKRLAEHCDRPEIEGCEFEEWVESYLDSLVAGKTEREQLEVLRGELRELMIADPECYRLWESNETEARERAREDWLADYDRERNG